MHAYLSHKNVWHVQVPGALLSLGDAHTSQGDSEFDGTAIETSLTATLKITLHKKGSLPKFVSKLNFPLLENANEYVVHGFTYNVSALIFPVFLLSPLSCMVCSPERVNTSEHCDLSSLFLLMTAYIVRYFCTQHLKKPHALPMPKADHLTHVDNFQQQT